MGSYTLALLTIVRLIVASRSQGQSSPVQLAIKSASGAALGLALAGLYLVPAIYERRFVRVTLATLGGMSINQNFLFGHMGTTPDAVAHDTVLHTASLVAVILLVATAAALVGARIVRTRLSTDSARESFPFLSLTILSACKIGLS